jgi:uncharacterized protein (TIGR02145 family)
MNIDVIFARSINLKLVSLSIIGDQTTIFHIHSGTIKMRTKMGISILNTMGMLLMIIFTSFKGVSQESTESIKDCDGNVYKIIKIGTQIWLAENLKTTKFNDSTEIQLVIDETIWAGLTTPSYCWYNNDIANKSVYGALYNWYAVNTKKLCPTGWHVPFKDEWTMLAEYVKEDGGKLKEVGPTLFHNPKYNPNVGATNSSGFSALLGGFRSHNGIYYSNRQAGFWWSGTEYIESDTFPEWNFNNAMSFSLGIKSSGYGNQHNNKLYGYSIRCLKDN